MRQFELLTLLRPDASSELLLQRRRGGRQSARMPELLQKEGFLVVQPDG
jgi:hypothetical protein